VFEFETEEGLIISFQRYPYPASGSVGVLPASCGALPIAVEEKGHLIIPSPSREAFWIGLLARSKMQPPAKVQLHGELCAVWEAEASPSSTAAGPAVFWVPPHQFVMGILKNDGEWWPLAREVPATAPACCALTVTISAPASGVRADTTPADHTEVRIDVLDTATFEALSRLEVEPLDTSHAYGHWRLP
jgi:hypothetical protein